MLRLFFLLLIIVFILDFAFRVFTVAKAPREVQNEFENVKSFTHVVSEPRDINPHMFGEYKEDVKKVEAEKTPPPKKKKIELKVELLAIYHKPQPHVVVILDGNKSTSKFSVGTTLKGYTLVSVEKNTATFEKQGKTKELKVFK